MFAYAYPFMSLVLLIIWLSLFLLLKRGRSAILWTSLVFAPAGPIGEYWLLPDYWRPHYLFEATVGDWRFGVEDYVTTFAFAGISAGLFEAVAGKKGLQLPPHTSSATLLRMTGWGSVGLFLIALLVSGFRLPSIHASLLSVLVTTLLMLRGKVGILTQALPVAVISGVMFWLFYVLLFIPVFPGAIESIWNLERTFGIMLSGVPIEEMLWASVTTLFSGPVYRVCSISLRK